MRRIDADRLAARLAARLAGDLEQHNIDGASVAVWQEDRLIYSTHVGKAAEGTLYRLASMTKPVTAVAVLTLCDKGLLSLDDPLARYLPAFSHPCVLTDDGGCRPVEKTITLRHLLSHTSGVASGLAWTRATQVITAKDRASMGAFVDFLAGQPLSFVPGEREEYSGIGAFSLLAAVVQKVSGQDFETFCRKEIFEPCRMTDTTYLPSREQWARVIPMHGKKDGVSVVVPMHEGCVFENYPAENYLGGAGLVSSLEDYLRFARMLLDGGVFEGRRVLAESLVREMATPQVSEDVQPGAQRWGLGVRVITREGHTPIPKGTFGWSGAYGTHFWVNPVDRIAAVYLKNSAHDGGSGAITALTFEHDVADAMDV